MYEKIKQIDDNIWNKTYKLLSVIWIILFILTVLLITVKQEWPKLSAYPENSYKDVEDEAKKMVYNHNLETDLSCTYTYNNTTNCLSLELYDSDNKISITATVSDYNTNKQKINIKRGASKLYSIFANFFLLFAIPFSLALLILIILMIISGLVHFIVFIFITVRKKISGQKE